MQQLCEPNAIPAILSQLAGTEIAAFAVVCTVGHGIGEAVTAYLTPASTTAAAFRHAIEMEGAYTEGLLSFSDPSPPQYGGRLLNIDLVAVAGALGVDRVVCLVAQAHTGEVTARRDYHALEVTRLESAKAYLDRFVEHLSGIPALSTAGGLQ